MTDNALDYLLWITNSHKNIIGAEFADQCLSIIEKIKSRNYTADEFYSLVKESAIQKAKGEAEAIREVQQAKAEGLKMLKEAGMDASVLKLRSLEAFEKAADGQATKIIVPSDLQSLAGVVTSVAEIAKK